MAIFRDILTNFAMQHQPKHLNNMTKNERHSAIMNLLMKNGSIAVTELSDALKVSSVTIRKDLTELEKQKKLYRNHGKAMLIDPYMSNRSVNEKEKLFINEKQAIARLGASIVNDKESSIIASGSSVTALARELVTKDQLTVISASMTVSEILCQNDKFDIIQLGGFLRHSSLTVVGKYAEMCLADFACSKLFLGVDGIDIDFGLTTTNLMEAQLNRVMMNAAAKTIVLADSSKFGKRGFSRICGIEDVDHIITDRNIPDAYAKHITDMGIRLTIADVDSI